MTLDTSRCRPLLAAALAVAGPLPVATVDALVPLFVSCPLAAGATLLHPGQALPEVLVVEGGLLRFFALDETGAEWNKGFVAEGDLFGAFVSAAPDWPAPHGVQALEDSRLWRAPWSALQAMAGKHAPLQAAFEHQTQRSLERKARRLLGFQRDDALTRYRSFLAEHADWARRLPQYHIASYLGISEVSLSRLRRSERDRPAS